MPGSTFPNGFATGVTIKNVPLIISNPGLVFWVSNAATTALGQNAGSDGNRGTFDRPFATLAYAVTQCVANRGDIIFVKTGHAETLSTATSLAMNIAGVAVIGMGTGTNRPTFTLSTANTATIAVSANNVSFTNCVFTANFLSIAACFTLTTAKWFTLQNCYFNETSSVLNYLNIVKSTGVANTVDGLTITDCNWNGLGTTSVNSFVLSANDIDSMQILRNRVRLARTATAAIMGTISAGVLTNLDAGWNIAISQQAADTGGAFINVGGTTSTGAVYNNYLSDLSTTDLFMTTSVALSFFENKKSGVISASGYLLPAADS